MCISSLPQNNLTCLSALNDDAMLWNKRLGHASLSLLKKVCDACAKGKQVKNSFKSKRCVSTSRPLEMLHIDLCGPMRIMSKGGKRCVCVIVDGYSRFTWTLFLASKDETFEKFVAFLKKVEKRVGHSLVLLRCDHGTEFENSHFIDFCSEHGMEHNFSAP